MKRLNANHTRVLANSGAEYYEGFGHFVSPHRVQVGDGVVLEAESILIATGGKPLMPSFPGNEFCGTSDTFWELEELPKRSLVIGGGYIAVEMAGILNALGSETSLACRFDRPLRRYDPFITDLLMEEMARTGLKLLPNCVIERVEIYPERRSDGRIVKRIEFRFPVYFNGSKITGLGWDETDMSETVMVLSKLSDAEQTGLR